jgi:hypothetical protein
MNINLHNALAIAILTVLSLAFCGLWHDRVNVWQSLKKTDTIVFAVIFIILFMLGQHWNILLFEPS